MILVVGATGRLGSAASRSLLNAGTPVRVLTRTAKNAEELRKLGAQVYVGDLRDAESLAKACRGVDKVFAAAHSFMGAGKSDPKHVDGAGNRSLMDAAKRAGVEHFVFTSVAGCRADHPIDFFRIKYETETYLRKSGLGFTIIRPTVFMDFWAVLIGDPIMKQGRTTIFGSGRNPVNFVAASDVARFVTMALRLPEMRGQTIEVGGPENLTLNEVAAAFERASGHKARIRHVARPVMHLLAGMTAPVLRALSRQMKTGIVMDTKDLTLDMTMTLMRYPMSLTRLEEFIATRYAPGKAKAIAR